jgi:hypothetical protein
VALNGTRFWGVDGYASRPVSSTFRLRTLSYSILIFNKLAHPIFGVRCLPHPTRTGDTHRA